MTAALQATDYCVGESETVPRCPRRVVSRFAPRHPRHRPGQRRRFPYPGPRRQRVDYHGDYSAEVHRRGAQAARTGAMNPPFTPAVPQLFADGRQGQGVQAGRADQRRSTTHCRPCSAATTSTTSTASAASWKVFVEAEPRTGPRPADVGQFYVRNGSGEMVPLSTLGRRCDRTSVPNTPPASTSTAASRSSRARARLQHRPGDERGGRRSRTRSCRVIWATPGTESLTSRRSPAAGPASSGCRWCSSS